jgi:hypothetical protein
MKKYFALFLIALMAAAVVSAAGVVTTKPVAAAPDPAPYVIDVGPDVPAGTTYSWKSNEMNFHYTAIAPGAPIVAKSKGSTTSVTLNTQPGQYAHGGAGVGVALEKTSMWEEMKHRPVEVKITTKTDVTIKGDKLVHTEVGVSTLGTWPSPQPSKSEFVLLSSYLGSPTQNVVGTLTYSATETTTVDIYSSTSGTPLTLENVVSGISANVWVETCINPSDTIPEYASVKVVVESIELTLLAMP